MTKTKSELDIEKYTVQHMIKLYCRRLHGGNRELCKGCEELMQYVMTRLNTCPYKENKSTCRACSTHCYTPYMRNQIKKVMRYSGPRMVIHHPVYAMRHLIKSIIL